MIKPEIPENCRTGKREKPMKKKTVHIISHSHWDREWYLPLERHKMKLLDLIDTNMELFDKDPGFYSFHLDGQTIVLDDYLEIRPEKREEPAGVHCEAACMEF